MIDYRTIAGYVARDIFAAGDEAWRGERTQRIQFMGGEWPDNETEIGGFCEEALRDCIEKSLLQHLSSKGSGS